MTIKKFLYMLFMCHRRPDRSFFINGKKFPLCARCTGMYLGYILGITIAIMTKSQNYLYITLLAIPMIVDGVVQLFFNIESNNIRRFITGILGGIGIIYILISVHMFTVWWVTSFIENYIIS